MPSLLKDKTEKLFPKISSPHLFAAHSSSQIVWGFFAALIPIWIAGVVAYGFAAVWVFVLAVGFSCGAQYVFGKRTWIQLGGAAFMGGLLTLLLPAQIPWQGVALGSLISSLMGQVAFGGLGQNIFHPALVGYAALFLLAPDWFSNRASESLGTTSIFAVVFSSLFLLFKKWIAWRTPFFYLLALGVFSSFFGRSFISELFNGSIFLAAFFFMADPVTAPMTSRGRAGFAIAAAFLTAMLRFWAEPLPAALCSVFFLNGFVPLLDRWTQPKLKMAS